MNGMARLEDTQSVDEPTVVISGPLPLATDIDIPRFMGDWYVITGIPTFPEKQAYNAVETYELLENGRIQNTFTFNKGSLDGALKRYRPSARIVEGTGNAIWKMRFLWPFESDFRIAFVDPDYFYTIIAREKRDYVWVMAREPNIPSEDYFRLVKKVRELGYDSSKLRDVPHSP